MGGSASISTRTRDLRDRQHRTGDSSNQPNPGTTKSASPSMRERVSAASIKDRCASAGITRSPSDRAMALPQPPSQHRSAAIPLRRGRKGSLGNDWNYDAYYQRGTTKSYIDVDQFVIQNRYAAAANAVTLDGTIVCADPRRARSGCQPINIFGGATPSAATLAYIMPQNGPFQDTTLTQDVASVNLSGNLLDLWAGPLSVAFGGEYRHEYYRVNADPYGAGVSSISPNSPDYPIDPLLNCQGSNCAAGNYNNGSGAYPSMRASSS